MALLKLLNGIILSINSRGTWFCNTCDRNWNTKLVDKLILLGILVTSATLAPTAVNIRTIAILLDATVKRLVPMEKVRNVDRETYITKTIR